jgi:hypothetical protein
VRAGLDPLTGSCGERTIFGMEPLRLSLLARLCWAVDARRWLLSLGNVIAATLFVIGCVGFYLPRWYVGSVTLFLVGSLLFLLSALGHALVEHGPST